MDESPGGDLLGDQSHSHVATDEFVQFRDLNHCREVHQKPGRSKM